MLLKKSKWNPKVDKFVKSIGGMRHERVGFYVIGYGSPARATVIVVDLTSTGTEPEQITLNILRQF